MLIDVAMKNFQINSLPEFLKRSPRTMRVESDSDSDHLFEQGHIT